MALILFYAKSVSAAPRHLPWFKHCALFCSVPSRMQPILMPLLFKQHNRPRNANKGSSRNSQSNKNDASELDIGYPVQIIHQGHTSTIFVRKGEPILHALERQSTSSSNKISIHPQHSSGVVELGVCSEEERETSSLAISYIPNECRRGNCLTCSARLGSSTSEQNNIHANVNNGLSPTVDTDLTQLGYILTCCSFVTGPGVTLELEQNDDVWDAVYRRRICNTESMQLGMEAQARLLRRVDEENVGRWKRRMEKVLEGTGDDEPKEIIGQ